jgi:hypothetical protein
VAVNGGAVYGVLRVAGGKTGTLIVSAFVTLRTEVDAVATVLTLSLTATEKVKVPVVPGVPLRVPVSGSSEMPGGRVPLDTEKV